MRTHALVLSLAAIAAAPSLLACADDTSSIASAEDDWRTKPQGTDVPAGSLVVRAPAAPGLVASYVDLMSTPPGRKLLDQAFEGIPVGQAKFVLTAEGANLKSTASVTVAINSSAQTEVKLGGLAINRVGGPATVDLREMVPTTGLLSKAVDGATASTLTIPPTSDGSAALPVIAGEHTFKWGLGDGIVVALKPGEVVKLDQWDYAQRAVTRIVPPARELPDACRGDRIETGSVELSNAIASTKVALRGPVEIGQNPKILGGHSFPIVMRLPCVLGEVSVSLGAVGAGPKELKLGRLDVDDVSVAMPDGSKKTVRGSYRVLRDGRDAISFRPSTNTGIDLPPGKYKVVVEYPTSAGTPGTFEETFTTP